MPIHRKATREELLLEIGNCTQAIKAFKAGLPWLAPDDLADAPSITWLEKQRRLCQQAMQEHVKQPSFLRLSCTGQNPVAAYAKAGLTP